MHKLLNSLLTFQTLEECGNHLKQYSSSCKLCLARWLDENPLAQVALRFKVTDRREKYYLTTYNVVPAMGWELLQSGLVVQTASSFVGGSPVFPYTSCNEIVIQHVLGIWIRTPITFELSAKGRELF